MKLISPQSFAKLARSSARVVPVDATRSGLDSFLKERVPNACFFDMDAFCRESPYPHMLPSLGEYAERILQLGIRAADTLVVYDKDGIFLCPRVAWILALYGHKNVHVLDNWTDYRRQHYPVDLLVTETVVSPLAADTVGTPYREMSPLDFTASYNANVIEYEELVSLVELGDLARDYWMLDARSQGRFDGTSPEPRPGLLSGHVPGSHCLPYDSLLRDKVSFKSKHEILAAVRDQVHLDMSNTDFMQGKRGIIVACGLGVTAVILLFAIRVVLGLDVPIRVYDGSWTEYAARAPPLLIAKV